MNFFRYNITGERHANTNDPDAFVPIEIKLAK